MRIDHIFLTLLVWICVVVGGIAAQYDPPVYYDVLQSFRCTFGLKDDAFVDSKGRFVLLKTSVRRKSSTYLPSAVGC